MKYVLVFVVALSISSQEKLAAREIKGSTISTEQPRTCYFKNGKKDSFTTSMDLYFSPGGKIYINSAGRRSGIVLGSFGVTGRHIIKRSDSKQTQTASILREENSMILTVSDEVTFKDYDYLEIEKTSIKLDGDHCTARNIGFSSNTNGPNPIVRCEYHASSCTVRTGQSMR